jgi:mono/diheme cytochrome c family protein
VKRFLFSMLFVSALIVSCARFSGRANELTYNAIPVASSAAELFAKHCASCHGKDGQAKTLKARLKHARNLTDGDWQDTVSDERIFNSIARGKGKMPGFSKKLSDSEIDSLVTYVRSLKR